MLRAVGVDLAGFDGTGHPIFQRDRIVFNGRAPAACEPFEVAVVEFDRRGCDEVRSYCKTAGMPYDLCVRSALIVLNARLGDSFRVSSDVPENEWEAARRLVVEVLGCGESFRLSRD